MHYSFSEASLSLSSDESNGHRRHHRVVRRQNQKLTPATSSSLILQSVIQHLCSLYEKVCFGSNFNIARTGKTVSPSFILLQSILVVEVDSSNKNKVIITKYVHNFSFYFKILRVTRLDTNISFHTLMDLIS